MEEALSFEGETGPYLQYAVVRANNIFHKLRERDGVTEDAVLDALPGTPATELTADVGEAAPTADNALWALVFEAARLDTLGVDAINVATNGTVPAVEQARTLLENAHAYPGRSTPSVQVSVWSRSVAITSTSRGKSGGRVSLAAMP